MMDYKRTLLHRKSWAVQVFWRFEANDKSIRGIASWKLTKYQSFVTPSKIVHMFFSQLQSTLETVDDCFYIFGYMISFSLHSTFRALFRKTIVPRLHMYRPIRTFVRPIWRKYENIGCAQQKKNYCDEIFHLISRKIIHSYNWIKIFTCTSDFTEKYWVKYFVKTMWFSSTSKSNDFTKFLQKILRCPLWNFRNSTDFMISRIFSKWYLIIFHFARIRYN